ncbi:DUF4439 domain-containing protein [Arthrobacter oryzae]|uniref:DUF4439 domain-containing protein n=1 Tax=Arthrobacter oryzae TaxID=409290 RepID=UPI001FC8FFAE|nr:DUF4439 domain-containing protein [Arthrobacter oryzae]
MNDESREKRRQGHFLRWLPRYALLACLALVVVSLGVAITPARPPEPVQPPFSDRARASALAETARLLDAGSHLGTAGNDRSAGVRADAAGSALGRTVTLLTTQAQALLAPGEKPPGTPGAAPAESGQATPTPATSPASPAPSGAGPSTAGPSTAAPSTAGPPNTGPSTAGPSNTGPSAAAPATASAAPLPSTAAGLVTALAHSGRQRLADAAMADGGMARLLAAVGTAQLLQASALAAATGTAAPAADVPAPQLTGTCPSTSAGSGEGATGTASPSAPAFTATPDGADGSETPGASAATSSAATVGTALAAVARTEAQTIYGYQVALPRLDGDAAKSAAGQLAHHDALLRSAESLSVLNCSAVPPREAGFTLSHSFLASPAAGLGNLEASALPVYGDLVALSGGETRQWAIAALFDAGKRTVLWGADPGPLPGLDRAALPPRPAG